MYKLLRALAAFKPVINNSIFRFLMGIPLTICALQSAEYFYNNNHPILNKISFTLGVFIFYYFMYLTIINQMFDRVYSFHDDVNSEKLNKNPLKFAFKHRGKIFIIYKSFGIAFILLGVFVIWIIH